MKRSLGKRNKLLELLRLIKTWNPRKRGESIQAKLGLLTAWEIRQ